MGVLLLLGSTSVLLAASVWMMLADGTTMLSVHYAGCNLIRIINLNHCLVTIRAMLQHAPQHCPPGVVPPRDSTAAGSYWNLFQCPGLTSEGQHICDIDTDR